MSTPTVATPHDAQHHPPTQAERLRQDAEAAAEVRALSNHPDVVALRVEKVRRQVDVLIWVGIALGLGFTMVNVQTFAAAGAAVGSLPWLAAWLLDPMVSLTLVAVLRAEQITARYQVQAGVWANRTKWFAFLATYVMNTWQSWQALNLSGIVLHSVPPVLVFCAAETAPWLRDRLTEAVNRAATVAFTGSGQASEPAADTEPAAGAPVPEPVESERTAPLPAVPAEPAPRKPARASTTRAKSTTAKPARRKLLADYLAEARAAWTPDVEVSPAWVREVTDCARGTSKNVADALKAELARTAEPAATPLPIPAPVEHELREAA